MLVGLKPWQSSADKGLQLPDVDAGMKAYSMNQQAKDAKVDY